VYEALSYVPEARIHEASAEIMLLHVCLILLYMCLILLHICMLLLCMWLRLAEIMILDMSHATIHVSHTTK
jgi:hypothetical protein